jgi:hypothetical protein
LATFPNCRCDTYKCRDGPYRVAYLGTNITTTDVRLWFRIELVGRGGQGWRERGEGMPTLPLCSPTCAV